MKVEMAELHEDKGGFLKRSDMTLRDYFAGQALAGIYANKGAPVIATYDSPQNRALICYAMADAMLEARK